jgi:hypothetical protein
MNECRATHRDVRSLRDRGHVYPIYAGLQRGDRGRRFIPRLRSGQAPISSPYVYQLSKADLSLSARVRKLFHANALRMIATAVARPLGEDSGGLSNSYHFFNLLR